MNRREFAANILKVMAGSVVARMRQNVRVGVPNYICEVDSGRQGIDTFAFGSAYLGNAYTPFFVPGDPSAADFTVQNLGLAPEMAARLQRRKIENILKTGAKTVVTTNPGCLLQIRAGLAAAGVTDVEALHLADFLERHAGGQGRVE